MFTVPDGRSVHKSAGGTASLSPTTACAQLNLSCASTLEKSAGDTEYLQAKLFGAFTALKSAGGIERV